MESKERTNQRLELINAIIKSKPQGNIEPDSEFTTRVMTQSETLLQYAYGKIKVKVEIE